MTVSEKEWVFINEVIMKIYSINDLSEMRQVFLKLIQLLIPSDYSSCYLCTEFPETSLRNPVGLNLSREQLEFYINQLEKIDPFNPLKSTYTHGSAYRASDFFSDHEILTSGYYKMAWKPLNIRYTLFAGLSFENSFLGTISFYRKDYAVDFSDKEIELINILKEHLAIRIWRDFTQNNSQPDDSLKQIVSLQSFAENFSLTKRENEILELWANGLTDLEICKRLVICNNTLKKHIANIYKKLDISKRVELFKYIHK